jgi:hypothetical protein
VRVPRDADRVRSALRRHLVEQRRLRRLRPSLRRRNFMRRGSLRVSHGSHRVRRRLRRHALRPRPLRRLRPRVRRGQLLSRRRLRGDLRGSADALRRRLRDALHDARTLRRVRPRVRRAERVRGRRVSLRARRDRLRRQRLERLRVAARPRRDELWCVWCAMPRGDGVLARSVHVRDGALALRRTLRRHAHRRRPLRLLRTRVRGRAAVLRRQLRPSAAVRAGHFIARRWARLSLPPCCSRMALRASGSLRRTSCAMALISGRTPELGITKRPRY